MNQVLDEYKTSRINAMSKYHPNEVGTHWLSGWEQGFDAAIELIEKFHRYREETETDTVFSVKESFNYWLNNVFKP